jgi:hypothetical protein
LTRKQLVKAKATALDIQGLLETADQDLNDTRSQGLSADGKYVFAYGAALALSAAVVRAGGYKTRGQGHHETLFKVLAILLPQEKPAAGEFDRARKKRNKINYERPKQASDKEADDLLKQVAAFRDRVVDWLKKNHAALLPPPPSPPPPAAPPASPPAPPASSPPIP